MDLGERINAWRLAKGLNQKQLAEKSKLSRAYISVLESDPSLNPSQRVIEAIAGALGLSIADFYGKVPPPKKQPKKTRAAA